MIVVGDVLGCDLDGSRDLRIFDCCCGLFLLSCSCFCMCCFFARFMSALSMFLCAACVAMLCSVGCKRRSLCSLCCFLICLVIFVCTIFVVVVLGFFRVILLCV